MLFLLPTKWKTLLFTIVALVNPLVITYAEHVHWKLPSYAVQNMLIGSFPHMQFKV
jgi:hypothetical protein